MESIIYIIVIIALCVIIAEVERDKAPRQQRMDTRKARQATERERVMERHRQEYHRLASDLNRKFNINSDKAA